MRRNGLIAFAGMLLWLMLAPACSPGLLLQSYKSSNRNVDSLSPASAETEQYLRPLRDSLKQEMDEVLAECKSKLSKEKPESSLGNVLADLLLQTGNDFYGANADFAIINYGGIRIPETEGKITVGKVFEIMPFDNRAQLLSLTAEQTDSLCRILIAQGGWPVSGIQIIEMKGKVKILVRGVPLQAGRNYHVLISDYLARGGDNMSMLSSLPANDLKVLLRDLFIRGFREAGNSGKPIEGNKDGRFQIIR